MNCSFDNGEKEDDLNNKKGWFRGRDTILITDEQKKR